MPSTVAPMTTVNVKMGQVAWQAARLAKAQVRLADGELIALEKDGSLALTGTRRKASTCGRRWRSRRRLPGHR
jgi:hypothetical protein